MIIFPLADQGRPISLYDQPGNLHRGPGDIVNLWPDFGLRAGLQQLLIARNAIKPDSSSRWTRYKTPGDTADERFIIPFVISGKFGGSDRNKTISIRDRPDFGFENSGFPNNLVSIQPLISNYLNPNFDDHLSRNSHNKCVLSSRTYLLGVVLFIKRVF